MRSGPGRGTQLSRIFLGENGTSTFGFDAVLKLKTYEKCLICERKNIYRGQILGRKMTPRPFGFDAVLKFKTNNIVEHFFGRKMAFNVWFRLSMQF